MDMIITQKNPISQEKQPHQTPPFGGDLAIYIHWPFCKSKCPYCDFNSHVRDGVDQDRWRAALLRELEYMAAQVPNRRVTSIFFGGGTPSLMPPATAGALIEKVHALWPVSGDIEITLEANPTSVEADTFPEFKAAGINRVSLGVQSLRDEELKFLGRGHSAREAIRAIELAQKYFSRYSFDLIYARPNQTLADWERELNEALPLTGGHLSLYQLTIEENTAFHHAYKKGGFTLPDEDASAALYHLTEAMTQAHGLSAYEVSNYAQPGQESRHNLSYWQGGEYVGVGPGAHGRLALQADDGCRMSDDKSSKKEKDASSLSSVLRHPTPGAARIATATLKSPERWLESVEKQGHGVETWQEIDAHTAMEERLMMGLRLTGGIESAPFEAIVDPAKRALYIDKGLLADSPGRLQPTLAGRLVLNSLTAALCR